jgi:hypothetical protein
MARDERPVPLRLPWFVFAYGVLGLLGVGLAPWRGPYERALTAIMVTCFVLTALLWKLRGPVAESRPLSPIGRATMPVLAIVGWALLAAAIVVPM